MHTTQFCVSRVCDVQKSPGQLVYQATHELWTISACHDMITCWMKTKYLNRFASTAYKQLAVLLSIIYLCTLYGAKYLISRITSISHNYPLKHKHTEIILWAGGSENARLYEIMHMLVNKEGYCLMRESTSASSGPSWFSPPSSSSTNLFSSYSSTSTFRKRSDTVFFDMMKATYSPSDGKLNAFARTQCNSPLC